MFSNFFKTVKEVFFGAPIIEQYKEIVAQDPEGKKTEINSQITDAVTQAAPVKVKRTKKVAVNSTSKPRKNAKNTDK
jgi:hypothetical protein